jgi:hypothetical protein
VFSSAVIATYYNVIVGWALFYFALSFKKDMPWTQDLKDYDLGCLFVFGSEDGDDASGLVNPKLYYMVEFMKTFNKDSNCETFEAD